MRILLLMTLYLSAAYAADRPYLINDSFGANKMDGRSALRGDWKFGTEAYCKSDPELYKKYKDHGPLLKYDVKYKNAVIEFDIKIQDFERFVFTGDGAEGHIFRFNINKDRSIYIKAFGVQEGKKSTVIKRGKVIMPKNDWARISVKYNNEKVIVTVNKQTFEVSSKSYLKEKTNVKIGFAFGDISIKNFKMH